jgi:hypothetical protein
MEPKEYSRLEPTLPEGYRFEQQSRFNGYELFFPEGRRYLFSQYRDCPVIESYQEVFRTYPIKWNFTDNFGAYVEIQRDATQEQVEEYVRRVEKIHEKLMEEAKRQSEQIRAERLPEPTLEEASGTFRRKALKWLRTFLR